MNALLNKLTLEQWNQRYELLHRQGMPEAPYGGPLCRHVLAGDTRLKRLLFDPSPAALRLWNLLLTEEQRLHAARRNGMRIVGTMKDLGTVPVIAQAFPNLLPFYPDGAWWTPCIMEMNDALLHEADRLGIDETFCPVRAMLAAFVTRKHFPIPDLLICSAGAVCDDFSAIVQRLQGMGHPVLWWEIPHRRMPDPGELSVPLPGGNVAPHAQVAMVEGELKRVAHALADLAGIPLDIDQLSATIRRVNKVRQRLHSLRDMVFMAPRSPLPALEMHIAEMLAIHFCSDLPETEAVLDDLLAEAKQRIANGQGFSDPDATRVFWVNPVADLQLMNLLESLGGRLCGTDFMFTHALDPIPESVSPFEALARTAMADPMTGPASDRARRILRDARRFGAEAMVVCRIPGASHCATEGPELAGPVRAELGIPFVEIEVPPLGDAMAATIRTRLEALMENASSNRKKES
jgi:benzoyl-CoA reductase/2-hydroxyglutaryl-CoA dehydratase subunit BcrC/BadD/HgdB